ncbi:MAG: Uma2 family endonuclease, partial [Limnospira sp. PMC 289.06]|nr:Uma2 family endonuclease [Limnospira sp. PMC 289.06]MDT9313694.1 Uma2 family endonuclease [Limnospira sp. Paracas R14]
MHSTLTLRLPPSTLLHVTLEQFQAIAAANPDLRLER